MCLVPFGTRPSQTVLAFVFSVGKEVEEKNFTATRTVSSAWGAVVSLYAPTERLLKKFLLAGELVRIGCGPYSHVAENSKLYRYDHFFRVRAVGFHLVDEGAHKRTNFLQWNIML